MLIPSAVNGARVFAFGNFFERGALRMQKPTAPACGRLSRRHQSYIKRHHNGNNNKIAHKHTRWRALTFDPVAGYMQRRNYLFIRHTERADEKRRRAWPRARVPSPCKFIAFIDCASGVAADLIDYSVSINRH